MRTPGFTAEASLYRSPGFYLGGTSGSSLRTAQAQAVIPAQLVARGVQSFPCWVCHICGLNPTCWYYCWKWCTGGSFTLG